VGRRRVGRGLSWSTRRAGSRSVRVGGVVLALVAGLAAGVPLWSSAVSAESAVWKAPTEQVPVLESPQVVQPEVASTGKFAADKTVQEPVPVEELVDQRTATTSTWRNSDGTVSVRQ